MRVKPRPRPRSPRQTRAVLREAKAVLRRLGDAESAEEALAMDAELTALFKLAKRARAARGTVNELARARILAQGQAGELLGKSNGNSNGSSTYAESLRLQRIQRAIERDESVLERYIADCEDLDMEATIAGFLRFSKGRDLTDAAASSASDLWLTPRRVLAMVVGHFDGSITLDPASNARKGKAHVRAKVHFTTDEDGLLQDWHGKVFCNPPYGRALASFVEKAIAEYECGNAKEVILLVPNSSSTAWFRMLDPYPRCLVAGRLTFANSDKQCPHHSMLVYLGRRRARFRNRFRWLGGIYQCTKGWRPPQGLQRKHARPQSR